MKKYKILMSVGVTLFAVGAGIVLYPHISNRIYDSRMKTVITQYDEKVDEMYNSTDTEAIESEIAEIKKEHTDTDYTIEDYIRDKNIKIPEKNDRHEGTDSDEGMNWALISLLREQMEEYNRNLIENGQYDLNDPFSYEQASFDLYSYSIYDNVFGHISAPSIGMDLPIYLGANLDNMAKGAVHLSNSSMPIGGESTNAVFAGHRGIIGKIFFDNIVFLEEGDDVYVTNPWETLHYRVIETDIISPYDIERCYIREGKDLITLITCHPYGYTDFRYLVVCERTDD